MTTPPSTHAQDSENITLGISLAAIQIAVFFTFIYYCAYPASTSAVSLDAGLPTPFLFGLLVILCGTVLTLLYVVLTNRQDDTHV